MNRNIERPGGVFRVHMALIGHIKYLQEGNRVIFLNTSKVIYGERCESTKNDAVR